MDGDRVIAADVFVDGFAHLQAGERPIQMLRSGPVRFVRWGPEGRRGTGFTEEFFPVDLDAAAVLAHIRAAKPGPRRYVTMIGGEADDPAGVFAAAGYAVNSRESLMALDLVNSDVAPAFRGRLSIDPITSVTFAHPVTSVTPVDAERSHALQLAQTGRVRLITPAQLADPAVVVLQVAADGEPACTGKVALVGGHAFVSDIATLPAYRRRGVARSLMLGLHVAARDAGAKTTVLASSDMGRALYLGLGYRIVREIVLWEPANPPPSA